MVADDPTDLEKKFLPRNALLQVQPQRLKSLYPRFIAYIEKNLITNPRPFIPKFIEHNNYFGLYAIWFVRAAPYLSTCLYLGKATENRISDRLRNHCEGASNPRLRGWVALKDGRLRFTTMDFSGILIPKGFERSDFIGIFEDYFIWQFAAETNRKKKWK